VSEIAKLLHLRVVEFQEMYRDEILGEPMTATGERSHLRLVK
jgi:hypothetical protein